MNRTIAATMNSLRGVAYALRSEQAFRLETLALILAVLLGWAIAPDRWTWIALVGVVLVVLAVELLNTGLEKLCDHVHPGHHPQIGAIKDMGSAAVMCTLALAGLVWGAALLQAVGF